MFPALETSHLISSVDAVFRIYVMFRNCLGQKNKKTVKVNNFLFEVDLSESALIGCCCKPSHIG